MSHRKIYTQFDCQDNTFHSFQKKKKKIHHHPPSLSLWEEKENESACPKIHPNPITKSSPFPVNRANPFLEQEKSRFSLPPPKSPLLFIIRSSGRVERGCVHPSRGLRRREREGKRGGRDTVARVYPRGVIVVRCMVIGRLAASILTAREPQITRKLKLPPYIPAALPQIALPSAG